METKKIIIIGAIVVVVGIFIFVAMRTNGTFEFGKILPVDDNVDNGSNDSLGSADTNAAESPVTTSSTGRVIVSPTQGSNTSPDVYIPPPADPPMPPPLPNQTSPDSVQFFRLQNMDGNIFRPTSNVAPNGYPVWGNTDASLLIFFDGNSWNITPFSYMGDIMNGRPISAIVAKGMGSSKYPFLAQWGNGPALVQLSGSNNTAWTYLPSLNFSMS